VSAVVRRAMLCDAPCLHELILQHVAFEEGSATLTVGELKDMLAAASPSIRLLVSGGAEGLVGYAAVTFEWSLWRAGRHAHLDCLFVAQGARSQGIGKSLLAEVRRLVLVEGLDRLEWQTPAWNEDAARFYAREGARAEPKIRFTSSIVGPPED
jgi:GNAT superfamily N-acetyltransferase